MPRHYGDFDQNTVLYMEFTTVSNANSVAATLANGNCVIFKDNSNANSVEGLTLSLDWGVTGRHLLTVNCASNATRYSAGSFFHAVVMNGNVSGTSAAGYGVGSFTIRADSALKPTVAGRSVLVDANGNVSANVVIPTATMNANVVSWLGVTPQQLGNANGIVINGVNGGNIVCNITGNMTGSVGSMNGNVGGSILGNMNGNVLGTIGGLAASAKTDVANAAWDEPIAGHLSAGSTGLALNSAGSAGDPWSTAIPGAYGAGTAGSRLGRIPDIAAGGAGGLFIAGTNAATTVSITGNMTGNITGSVGSMNGNVGGSVLGNMNGNVLGSVGSVLGNVAGNVLGNMNGNVAGTVGSVTGNVGGNVNGSTASVLGNIGGNLAGDVQGSILGTLANISANAANFAANTLLDMPNGIEVGITPRLAIRYTASSGAGNLVGGNTATVVLSGVGVATTRITAAVEANGNTRAVTLS